MKNSTPQASLNSYLLILLIAIGSSASLQSQNRTYDSGFDPNTISLPTNEVNTTKFKDMVAVNEVGYVFWDWVYDSTFDPSRIHNQTVVNSFKNTFPKIRLFHLMEKDYNANNSTAFYPSNSPTIQPCTSAVRMRSGMCAIRDFYDAMRPDYDFIAASMTGLGPFPNGWFSLSEWGGTNAKQEAYEYALAFLETMDPDKNASTTKVNRFYTSNEAWGAELGITGYKDVCDGFIEGFTEYYQGNRFATPDQNQWIIKMWLGAFQGHKASHVWANDFIGAMLSTKSINALEGIDVHPYAFYQDGVYNNSLDINEHPESANGYFNSIKSLVKWRDNQTNNAQNFKISVTEFGWNDRDVYQQMFYQPNSPWIVMSKASTPGNPIASTMTNYPADTVDWKIQYYGVGQEAQALYSVRAYLLMARYGVESGYLYGSLNNNESVFGNCGVYDTEPLIQEIPSEFSGVNYVNYYNAPYLASDFIGEKKVMPAMRKLQDNNIIGDKMYLETIKEVDDGVYAILVGDAPNNPTHLVAWYGTKINRKNESQILGMTKTETLSQIGFPSNLSISTNQNYTRLDWNENSIDNIAPSQVYNSNTQTLTLTPIPIVIPVSTMVTGTACGTIAGYTKLGENNGKGYYKSDNQATSWTEAQNLSLAQGGYLVSMEEQTEKDYVDAFITGVGDDQIYYIGLFRDDISNNFQWTSGAAFNVNNYSTSPWESTPATSNNVVSLRKWQPFLDVKWGAETGSAYRRYIFEKECSTDCIPGQINTWVGPSVGTWNASPFNWSLNKIPDECDAVIIPAGNTITLLMNNSAIFYTLCVEDGAVLNNQNNTFMGQ